MTDSSLALPMLVGLVALALAFDFLNGLHDAANSIATVVSTRVLRPVYGRLLGRVLQFRRDCRIRAARRANPRHRDHRRRRGQRGRDFRRAGRGHRLEYRELASCVPDEQFACLDRRAARRRHRPYRHRRSRLVGCDQDGLRHRAGAVCGFLIAVALVIVVS